MKKVFILASLAVFASCNSSNDKAKVESMGTGSDSASNPNVQYAYPVTFSKFKIGDANNAKMVLDMWKDWDNGTLSNHKDNFADSVSFFVADGPPMMGPRDSVVATAQKFRNTISASESSVDAIVPLNNIDSSQNWVAVWGREIDTHKDGTKDTTYLNEAWRFNSNNKIDLVYQYNSKPSMPPPPPKK